MDKSHSYNKPPTNEDPDRQAFLKNERRVGTNIWKHLRGIDKKAIDDAEPETLKKILISYADNAYETNGNDKSDEDIRYTVDGLSLEQMSVRVGMGVAQEIRSIKNDEKAREVYDNPKRNLFLNKLRHMISRVKESPEDYNLEAMRNQRLKGESMIIRTIEEAVTKNSSSAAVSESIAKGDYTVLEKLKVQVNLDTNSLLDSYEDGSRGHSVLAAKRQTVGS